MQDGLSEYPEIEKIEPLERVVEEEGDPENLRIKKHLELIVEVINTWNKPLANITTPILKKEGMSSYTIYNLNYKDQGYQRRFSDFYFFRQKLVECWPGIYIPNIPPKKNIVE